MARQARFLEPQLPYHVTQRGNYKQDVFADDEDRHKYLNLLHFYAGKYHLEIWAYCLMDNHIHLVAYPENADSLSRALAVAHMNYAQYLHRKSGLVGHLWQGRFHSCALGEDHLFNAVRYVEMNPVRAKLVSRPENWQWSSARHHLGLSNSELLEENRWPDEAGLKEWPEMLEVQVSDALINKLRRATYSGRPLGSDTWIDQLEKRTGRRLRPGAPGRPKKS